MDQEEDERRESDLSDSAYLGYPEASEDSRGKRFTESEEDTEEGLNYTLEFKADKKKSQKFGQSSMFRPFLYKPKHFAIICSGRILVYYNQKRVNRLLSRN